MGLYSMLPMRVEGLVGRFADDDDDASSVDMRLILHPDPSRRTAGAPMVDMRVITDYHETAFWEFGQDHRRAARTTFYQNPIQDLELPLHQTCPATTMAYEWLASDLTTVRWLRDQ
jgi:hypothetical protein